MTTACQRWFQQLSLKMLVPKIFEVGDEAGLCVICNEDKCAVVAAPCGHCYACANCARKATDQRRCAVCRGDLHCFVLRELFDEAVTTL